MKTKLLTIIALIGITTGVAAQNIGIGTTNFTPTSDALLEMRSGTGGFLMPRMTQAQMEAIVTPTEGLLVYQTNGSAGFKYFDGSDWTEFGGGAADNFGDHTATTNIGLDDNWLSNDGDAEGIRIDDSGNVGIGTALPLRQMDVASATGGMLLLSRNSAPIPTDAVLGEIQFDGFGAGSVSLVDASASIRVLAAEAYGSGDKGANITFLTKGINQTSNTASTERMRISYNGNIGIGTATTNARMIVVNDGGTGTSDDIQLKSFSNSLSPSFTFQSAKGTESSPSNVTANNDLGKISFQGRTAGTNTVLSQIQALYTGNGTTNESEFRFKTSSYEHMRIDEIGRVSIGTGATTSVRPPKANLHLYGSGTSGYSLEGTSTIPNPGEGPEIGFGRGGFSNGLGASIQFIDYNAYSGGLAFLVHKGSQQGGGGAYADNWPNDVLQAMTIVNNGKIGIGTGDPKALLEVAGDARITDLAGSGTRMVVADADGDLSTQALPSSGSMPTTVVSSSNQNISSASYSSVSGMSISSVTAGGYLVNFNAGISRNGSSSCKCIVRAGGSNNSATERTFQLPSAGESQFQVMGKVTLSSTGTIEIRCKKIPGGSGISIKKRSMSIQPTN